MSHDTEFAGLTELDPGDPITVEGGAFTQKNPSRTDHYLRIGAVTHKHDAHVKLGDPTQTVASASAAQWPTGQVPADTQLFIAYTLDDRYGGETRRGPAATLTTPTGFAAPSASITATFESASGSLPVGQYAYALTLNDGGGGESTLGPAVFIQRPGGFASGEILLTGLAQELSNGGTGWASWNLWRATDGGSFEIVATNQVSDSFTDTGLICTDAARVPPNTMLNVAAHNAVFFALPTLAAEPGLASATTLNVYISLDGSFTDQCFFASFPVASAGQAVEIDSLVLHAGTPPNVSLASQGASQIDPDTDLLDWNWRRPVHTPAELPTSGNASGDVRACLTPEAIFMWDGFEWDVVAAASGVGGAGGGSASIYYSDLHGDGEEGEVGFLSIFGGALFRIGVVPIDVETLVSSGSAFVGLSLPEQVASANSGGSATMFRALEFVGSGGTTVEVRQNPFPWGFVDPGAGSAVVIITSPSGAAGPPGASGAPGPAGASGAQGPPGASGAPGPAGASGAQGPQGPAGPQGPQGLSGGGGGGAGGVFLAGSAGTNPTIFGAESYLEFVGSGGTGVALQDLTGGSARILISASAVAGPAGPAGASGAAGAQGPQGPTGPTGPAGTGGGSGGTDPHFSPTGSGLALGSAEVIEFYSGASGATGTGYGYIKGEFVASGLSPNTVDLTNGLSGSFSTFGGGGFTNWSESGGVVSATNTAGTPSIAATVPGQFDAGQVVGKFNAGGVCAVVLCGDPTGNNYVMGLVYAPNGACRIFKVVSGTATLMGNSGNFPSVSSPVWVKLSKSGNVYTLAHYSSDPDSGNPTAVDSTTWTVSGGDLTLFGTGVSGYAGVAGRDAANSAGFPNTVSFNSLVVSPLASETHNLTGSVTQAASKGGAVYTKRILRDDGTSDLAPDLWIGGSAAVSRPTVIDIHASGGLGLSVAKSGTGAVITIGGGFAYGSAIALSSGSAATFQPITKLAVVGAGYIVEEGDTGVLELDPLPPFYKDGFDTDSLGAGLLGTTVGSPAVTGSQLSPGGTGEARVHVVLAAIGKKPMRDGVIQVKFIPGGSGTDFWLSFGGHNSVFQISGGTAALKNFTGSTNTPTSQSVTITAGTPYWIRFELRMGMAFGEIWTKDPATRQPGDQPTLAISSPLGGATGRAFSYGNPGLRFNSGNAGDRVDDLRVWSYPEAIE